MKGRRAISATGHAFWYKAPNMKQCLRWRSHNDGHRNPQSSYQDSHLRYRRWSDDGVGVSALIWYILVLAHNQTGPYLLRP